MDILNILMPVKTPAFFVPGHICHSEHSEESISELCINELHVGE
jgi:hypothetical protein